MAKQLWGGKGNCLWYKLPLAASKRQEQSGVQAAGTEPSSL